MDIIILVALIILIVIVLTKEGSLRRIYEVLNKTTQIPAKLDTIIQEHPSPLDIAISNMTIKDIYKEINTFIRMKLDIRLLDNILLSKRTADGKADIMFELSNVDSGKSQGHIMYIMGSFTERLDKLSNQVFRHSDDKTAHVKEMYNLYIMLLADKVYTYESAITEVRYACNMPVVPSEINNIVWDEIIKSIKNDIADNNCMISQRNIDKEKLKRDTAKQKEAK